MKLFIDALLLGKNEVKKATKHYFCQRKTTPKYPCIDNLAQEWGISHLESFTYMMFYRAVMRHGSPVTLNKLCKTLHVKKKRFATQLRLMLYLRFACERDIITRVVPSTIKLSNIKYFLKPLR